ncbi:hypothetical protein FRB96_004322 [Tulasnella sp. 330]|nr:hypothetical protein FRB96_004322 [Tulasnella sp. 330]
MNRQTTHEWEGRLEILDTLPERLQLGSEMAVVELVDRINQELRRAKDSINRRGLAASIEVVTNRFTSFAASELTNGVVLVRNLKNDLGDLRIWLAGTNETASRLHTTATHALSSTSQLGGVVGTVNHGASRLGTSIGAANSDTPSAPISTTPNLTRDTLQVILPTPVASLFDEVKDVLDDMRMNTDASPTDPTERRGLDLTEAPGRGALMLPL